MATRQLLIEPLLPVIAGANAGVLVEVEEDPLKSELGQLCQDAAGNRLIETRMTDEK
jgi:hypothetical protein